jgi:thiosulfate/3-mercaptopyruvate sulfurtransferase
MRLAGHKEPGVAIPWDRRWKQVLILGLVSAILPACGPKETGATPPRPPAQPWELVVSAEWLAANGSGSELVIIDTRGPDDYAAGHIPGAVNVPRKATYEADPLRNGDSAAIPVIERLFSAAGVSTDTPVILYDDGTYRDAGRVFWVLEVHGHPHVAVLDGGLGAWSQRGLPLSAEPARPQPRQFIANLQPDRLASKLQVAQSTLHPGVTILDARSREEYVGEASKADRAGHIPTAINVDAGRSLAPGEAGVCSILSPEELATVYANVPESGRVIAYCTTGTRSSLSYLVLRTMGRDVALYDGSWREWSADATLPIATGQDPGKPIEGLHR